MKSAYNVKQLFSVAGKIKNCRLKDQTFYRLKSVHYNHTINIWACSHCYIVLIHHINLKWFYYIYQRFYSAFFCAWSICA